ncbi:glycoside hydrolase family 53 protein [Asticcacaulis machinosus]|uniref:Arabinogalactan endo-beta-1,4-galactanase n=1 Tax=Asticcacaulis machinosus TaxID=2984211 RepID=A0ABT5HGG1_9CAUL|nr:arabinogalactan endo-1,4-beta-galactosidase [Asticcacaulis machinosus]MDC7675345.1 arabinogalactan endo-1,4-beta-galactosidase [Asticcacaulis machinosus]
MQFVKSALPAVLSGLIALEGTPALSRDYYFGSDLSYVNEMEDCGATYRRGDKPEDIYGIFKSSGANLVRLRLWNDPKWTPYSNLADVTKAMRRAKAAGLPVLLDFHYSDDWADGDKQLVPAAWAPLNLDQQVEALYNFTYDTLMTLHAQGLMPDQVQVGNETNGEMMGSVTWKQGDPHKPTNWERNARLFNAGIKAVKAAGEKAGKTPRIMLHIAQPENVESWFLNATKAGITGYDLIGISYYKKWSKMDMAGLGAVINRVRHTYPDKDIVVVETAYPFTDKHLDTNVNLMGEDSTFAAYGFSPQGQARYLHDLMQLTLDNGGVGVVYWEPAWVSTKCKTRWGGGSNWENAAFFDFDGKALPALDWPKAAYVYPVELTFRVKDTGQSAMYLSGDFTGGLAVPMIRRDGYFRYSSWLRPGSVILAGVATTPDALKDAPAQEIKVPPKAAALILSE